MSQLLTKKISNKYLGVSRIIKGRNSYELNTKVSKQLQQWKEREKKERQKALVSDLKALAEINTKEAQDTMQAFQSILKRGLQTKQKIHWESLYDHTVFQESPTLDSFLLIHKVPKEERSSGSTTIYWERNKKKAGRRG